MFESVEPKPWRPPSDRAPTDWIASEARVEGGGSRPVQWSSADLTTRVAHLARAIAERLEPGSVVGLLADNSPDWIVIDLALQAAGMILVPLPGFFSQEQTLHAIQASAMQSLFCTDSRIATRLGFSEPGFTETMCATGIVPLHSRSGSAARATASPNPAISKITFTSGTTGTPKAVLLSSEQQLATARALAGATAGLGIRRHLCLLPLSVLLENVAGLYTALMTGAACVCPALDEVGMSGASSFDARRCLNAIAAHRADSLILLPQMLHALVAMLTGDRTRRVELHSLKFVAVGGAKTPVSLIRRARELGLPVYEGYGLSECTSVVCLNLPGADRIGSVGRPLAGVALRLANDGEVEVSGRGFAGYLGTQGRHADEWLASGDLGTCDAQGYLSITGRKKNTLITGFGRNVSPEWPESLLAGCPAIGQAVVFGDAAPFLVAVLVPAAPEIDDTALQEQVDTINTQLPDYARIGGWVRASAALTDRNGLATVNGRIRRDAVLAHFAPMLDALYRGTDHLLHPGGRRGRSTAREGLMSFFDELQERTASERQALQRVPIIRDAGLGRIDLSQYIAFLTQAYHHVRHTTPLLMACGARLPQRLSWMRAAIARYITEEIGHDEWILSDLAACGADPDETRNSMPAHETEMMVSFAYHQIDRGNPVGFFGMVHVLEGTSAAIATSAADAISASLQLPPRAFTYLTSHGSLDVEHTRFFAELMNTLDDSGDQAAVVHCASAFYRLYGNVFRSLPWPQDRAA